SPPSTTSAVGSSGSKATIPVFIVGPAPLETLDQRRDHRIDRGAGVLRARVQLGSHRGVLPVDPHSVAGPPTAGHAFHRITPSQPRVTVMASTMVTEHTSITTLATSRRS